MSTLDLGNSFHVITFVLVKSDKERSPAGEKKKNEGPSVYKPHTFTVQPRGSRRTITSVAVWKIVTRSIVLAGDALAMIPYCK